MILRYSVENFRSIYKKREINFVAKNLTDLKNNKNHLLKNNILPIISIYGSNGGGKTSLIESILILKRIVLSKFDNQSYYIKILKNRELENDAIKWEIDFMVNNETLKYKMHFNSKIIFEEYIVIDENKKEKLIFRYDDKSEKKYIHNDKEINIENLNHMTSMLYFFNTIFEQDKKISLLLDEFNKLKWILNTSFDDTPFKNESNFIVDKVFFKIFNKNKNRILNIFNDLDINIKDFRISQMPNNQFNELFVINSVKLDSNNKEYELPFEYESNGTKKIFNLIMNVFLSMDQNYVFIIDELDSGLHTKLLRYIIEIFTNQINSMSQLIYTSHDIGTLDNKLLRRDEIYFSCLNENNFTNLICLYDFGKDIRNTQSYSKIYHDGKIGYEPYIDYSLKGFYGKK